MRGLKNIKRIRTKFDIKIKWNSMIRYEIEEEKINQKKIKNMAIVNLNRYALFFCYCEIFY